MIVERMEMYRSHEVRVRERPEALLPVRVHIFRENVHPVIKHWVKYICRVNAVYAVWRLDSEQKIDTTDRTKSARHKVEAGLIR